MKNTILYPYLHSKNTAQKAGCIIYSVFANKWEMKGLKLPISGFGAGAKKQAANPYHIASAGNGQVIIAAHTHGENG